MVEHLTITEVQPVPEKKKAPPRKSKKKKPAKRPAVAKTKPLPPPVPVQAVQPQKEESGLFGLDSIFQQRSQSEADLAQSSAISSTSAEPKPGQPLSAEAEQILNQVMPDARAPEDGPEPGAAAAVGELIPNITFSPAKVEKYLNEIFDWLAIKLDDDCIKLTATQSDMVAEPTAQMLGFVWSKVAIMLPDALTSIPGGVAFLFAWGVVLTPKTAQYLANRRARSQGAAQSRRAAAPGPVAVPRTQAVGPMNDGPIQPLSAEE